MAFLPSFTLTSTLKLDPELKRHSSPSPFGERVPNISQQRSSADIIKLDESVGPPKPLEFHESLSLLKEGNAKVESFYYVPLLQHCLNKNSLPETRIVHAHVVKTGTIQDFFIMSVLVNVYAKCGDMASSRRVFDRLERNNVVVWTSLMTGYVQNSEPEVAIDVFREMLESGAFPSNFTLGIVLNACTALNSIEVGKQFHAFIIKYRIDHDSSIGNALCSLYSKFGHLESAANAFGRIEEKNVISWTAIVSACGENGQAATGLKYFYEMLLDGVEPNEYTLTSVMSLCGVLLSLDVGKQIHSISIKLGYRSNLRVKNSIMYLYLKCGCIDEARRLFSSMESVSLVTWNEMIAGHTQAMDLATDDISAHQSGTEALLIYLKLNRSGMKPDLYTFSSVLTVCSQLVAFQQGEQVHAQTIKSGFLSDVIVGTALVNMYSKCASIERASKAFVEMPTRTMISWTTMITSFARQGRPQQALQLFEDMRLVGIRPNQITFVGVLAACSHAGMINEALGYFEMMQKEYRLRPVMDHYGCLVDAFVRLGRLDEAFDFIKKMEFKPSEFVWLLLIAGCKNHGKEELGFYAAEQLLKMKPKDIETYVMLLNMYISAERWNNVELVTKIMQDEKIPRLNDWSWMSIKDKVHSFEATERLLPNDVEIHKQLDDLLHMAKGLGYEPLDSTQAIEVDKDDKNISSAVYHSEKVALAFGLLNTHSHEPIRIVKSIGMCKDCHNFVKIVSPLTNRNIIVRDSKCLHNFFNGRCSCADFGVHT